MKNVISFKRSRRSFIGNYILSILLIIFFILSNSQWKLPSIIVAFFLILIIFFLLEPEASIVYKTYHIGKNYVYEVKGILSKKKISIPYASISNVRLEKGVIGRMFHFGDIIIESFSTNLVFKGIARPEKKFKLIEKNVERAR